MTKLPPSEEKTIRIVSLVEDYILAEEVFDHRSRDYVLPPRLRQLKTEIHELKKLKHDEMKKAQEKWMEIL